LIDSPAGRQASASSNDNAEEAATAILHLNGSEWMGRTIRVNEAKRREVSLDTNSRSGGGGFGSRKLLITITSVLLMVRSVRG
jgi:hypothetical protein